MTVIKGKSPKQYFWLKWDGTLSAKGAVNASGKSPRQAMGEPIEHIKFVPGGTSADRFVVPTGVSVRMGKFADTLATDKGVRIPIQLKNPRRVRSMLMRVYDRADAVAYQETLDAANLQALTPLTTDETKALKLSSKEDDVASTLIDALKTDPRAGAVGSPYRVEVWVSALEGAFTNIGPDTTREQLAGVAQYEKTVSNEYKPKIDEVKAVYERLAGRDFGKEMWTDLVTRRTGELSEPAVSNDPKYKPRFVAWGGDLPRLRVVIDEKNTGNSPSWCVNSIDTRIASLTEVLKECNQKLNEADQKRGQTLPATPLQELRLLLCPEWFFRKDNKSAPYTPKEMRTILNKLHTLSKANPSWVLFPGTIWFGLGLAKPLAELTADELKTAQADVLKCMKVVPGAGPQADVARAEPGTPKAFLIGNLGVVFHDGKLVHWSIKREASEASLLNEHFAPYWVPQQKLPELCGTSFFPLRGIEFAYEICRDTRVLRAALENSGDDAKQFEALLGAWGGWVDELKNALDDAEAELVLPAVGLNECWARCNAIKEAHKDGPDARASLRKCLVVFDELINKYGAPPDPNNAQGKAWALIVGWLRTERTQFHTADSDGDLATLVAQLKERAGILNDKVLRQPITMELSALFGAYRGPAVDAVAAAKDEAKKKLAEYADARKNWRKDIGLGAPPKGSDVHVVVSNNVEIDVASWVARSGGLYLKCDGENADAKSTAVAVKRADDAPNPLDGTNSKVKAWLDERKNDFLARTNMIFMDVLSALAEAKKGADPGLAEHLTKQTQLLARFFGEANGKITPKRSELADTFGRSGKVTPGPQLKGRAFASEALLPGICDDRVDLGPKAR